MSWPQIVIIAYLVFSALAVTAGVGKPREPITPSLAVTSLITVAGLIWLVTIA